MFEVFAIINPLTAHNQIIVYKFNKYVRKENFLGNNMTA